jgi:hypothetical protein
MAKVPRRVLRSPQAADSVEPRRLLRLHLAPTLKENFYTVLSAPRRLLEAERLLTDDPRLARCFGV